MSSSFPMFGRNHIWGAFYKESPKEFVRPYVNAITRRPCELVEQSPNKACVNNLANANLKSLRLFRHICRLTPYIIKIQQLTHRVTPVQSKVYVANWFRNNANLTDLTEIDIAIKFGYDTVYEAEMNYINSGYLYRFMIPNSHKLRDFGINRFYEKKADRVNTEPNSKFLSSFYQGTKSHVD